MGRRENTFRIDFSNAPKTPSYEEVHNFVGHQLGLTRENVLQLQPNRRLGCVYVKVTDFELAERVIEEHDNKHEIVVEGKSYKVRIIMEDGAVEVRLFDLSEFVTNEAIADFLKSYGQVLSVRDVLWDDKYFLGGVSTGVRAARMIVAENIPSVVVIDGQTTSLSYKGQRQTCIHCNEFVHTGIPCVQNKKLLVQKLTADQNKPSYAKVAKMPTQPSQPRKQPLQRQPTKQQPAAPATAPADSIPSTSTVVIQVEDVRKTKTNLMPPPAFPRPAPERTQHDGSESDASQSSIASRTSTNRRQKNPPNKKMKPSSDFAGLISEGEST